MYPSLMQPICGARYVDYTFFLALSNMFNSRQLKCMKQYRHNNVSIKGNRNGTVTCYAVKELIKTNYFER